MKLNSDQILVEPGEAWGEAMTGTVQEAGPDCEMLKAGDRVIYEKTGVENDVEMFIMREGDVLAVL